MTLRISLRDGEKMVVNGAVLRSVGRTDLAIDSKASILRGREVMAPEEADKTVWHAMRHVRRMAMRRLETGKAHPRPR